jgi:hypothetical protein
LPRPEQKSVTMSGRKLKELEQSWETEKKKRPNLSFAGFISELALIELERRNMLREAGFISLAAPPDGNTILLRDSRKGNRIFEVQILANKKLKCMQDKDYDCVHVGFALALPETRKALSK